jgi:hypothetical protein
MAALTPGSVVEHYPEFQRDLFTTASDFVQILQSTGHGLLKPQGMPFDALFNRLTPSSMKK